MDVRSDERLLDWAEEFAERVSTVPWCERCGRAVDPYEGCPGCGDEEAGDDR